MVGENIMQRQDIFHKV